MPNPFIHLNIQQQTTLDMMGIGLWENKLTSKHSKVAYGQYLVTGQGDVAIVVSKVPTAVEEKEFLKNLNLALGEHCSIVAFSELAQESRDAANSLNIQSNKGLKITEPVLLFMGEDMGPANELGYVFKSVEYYLAHPLEKAALWEQLRKIG